MAIVLSFHSMLKLRSTELEDACQFNNFALSSGLMFGRVIFAMAPQPWFSHYGTSTSTVAAEPLHTNQLLHHR